MDSQIKQTISRRDLLLRGGAASLVALLPEIYGSERAYAAIDPWAPSAPVAIARCETYGAARVTNQLSQMFNNIGGIKKLVAGKTVAVKVNLTASPGPKALNMDPGRTYQVHPDVVMATAILLERAGAKRVRFLEGTYSHQPIQKTLIEAGWDLKALAALSIPVEFEDTRNAAKKGYVTLKVPGGGDLFPAYTLNRSYVDCDVYVSLAKLKNHRAAGVTLGMKNSFGITPTSLYANSRGEEEFLGARMGVIHAGTEKPAAGVAQEIDPSSPRLESYRVPRHIVDITAIRPVDLTIIDGIETISAGEGPWHNGIAFQKPGLLLVGRNVVCTDAVATACMGCNPLSERATGPFPGDNHLVMAAKRGLGTCDLKQIEVRGLSIKQALHSFGWEPDKRNT